MSKKILTCFSGNRKSFGFYALLARRCHFLRTLDLKLSARKLVCSMNKKHPNNGFQLAAVYFEGNLRV